MKSTCYLAAGFIWAATLATAQDADLTILVDGALLEHGGRVEVMAVPAADAQTTRMAVTLSDRYAQLTLIYPEDASYNYRFRPAPEALSREGMDRFATQVLSVGSHSIPSSDGKQEADFRAIRVLPFQEYAPETEGRSPEIAWGTTQAFDDPPPANSWGARALANVFERFGDARQVRLICRKEATIEICTPDPKDSLLMEALWWRSIAEGRLERLRFDALDRCYQSGGLFRTPDTCEAEAGDGWPSYRPAR